MTAQDRLHWLRIALYAIGMMFIFGVASMMWLWPAGWGWTPRQPEYELMIIGVYATLGVFLVRAAKDPLAHLSLIWFTVWSSLVHATIMLVEALLDPTDRINLLGDIPALFLVGLLLWFLMPRRSRA